MTGSVDKALGVATLALIGVGSFMVYRAITTAGAQGAGAAAGRGAVDLGKGVVVGIGDSVGLPRPAADKCADAIRRGSRWDASLHCDAPTFIRSLWGGVSIPVAPGRTEYVTRSGLSGLSQPAGAHRCACHSQTIG
ncbi:hypothetical protein [Nevskia ramosa]|uniref:hypothetical protein n=1 Tax=Nevskia ramosa TaxID=64002 RepID=UPI0003B60757|nr:hypothetical protein [Nevskia ramosa]